MIAPVKGEGFADIFEGNAYGNGLLPLELPEAEWEEISEAGRSDSGAEVTIDLKALTLTLHGPSGEKTFAIEVPETQRHRLLHGLDAIAETLLRRARHLGPRGEGAAVDHAAAGVKPCAFDGKND